MVKNTKDERHWSITDAYIKEAVEQSGQPKLEEKNTGIKTYDIQKMKYLGAFFSTVHSNNRQVTLNTAVVDADRNFGLLGLDIFNPDKHIYLLVII